MGSSFNQELYDAIYKNSIYPHHLLENLKDPDYLQVKFDSYMDGIKAEVKFNDEGNIITTNYYFNKKEYIQRIEIIENETVTVLYDRLETVVQLLSRDNQLDRLEEVRKLLSA